MSIEPSTSVDLKRWLTSHGGFLHPLVSFTQEKFGLSAIAQDTINTDTTIVSCPLSLVIDVQRALHALTALLGESTSIRLQSWSERQLICTYICFHWIIPDSSLIPDVLRHTPYLKSLPPTDALLTPLQFTPSELEAFRGTNIYGATHDRQESWNAEWNQCQTFIHAINSEWADKYTWDKYLIASTYLSTRAFPSTLLSRAPTLQTTSSSYPIMIPGVDILNHSRGQPVTWFKSYPDGSTDESDGLATVSIISHTTTRLGEEVFNNYGLKANDELILGYGFSLPQNPDDKITLQMGGSPNKWIIDRHAHGAEGLWNEVRQLVAEDPKEIGYESDLAAAELLLELVQKKYDLLPEVPHVEDATIRPAVRLMLEHYLEGQRDVLNSLKSYFEEKEGAAIEAAREAGVEFVFDDE
ncbi:SET domain-containing protein [Rhizopogon vinicolor AM-OR11-026]|uniref:SET domain-containing protein n=1 Tax=Rhizopogon vinicolor AM-OR11-026 TaxID=1314800 RepID=A0A1B7NIH4_9AGAM|nr:SET domain-containing protein [Rhizopogon vinicolor AM-OR11-026]